MIRSLPSYERAAKKLKPGDLREVELAIVRLPEVFGRPHRHSGLGIRRFGPYFEFRVGLRLRILFLPHAGDFHLAFVGNHEEVAQFVRHNR